MGGLRSLSASVLERISLHGAGGKTMKETEGWWEGRRKELRGGRKEAKEGEREEDRGERRESETSLSQSLQIPSVLGTPTQSQAAYNSA